MQDTAAGLLGQSLGQVPGTGNLPTLPNGPQLQDILQRLQAAGLPGTDGLPTELTSLLGNLAPPAGAQLPPTHADTLRITTASTATSADRLQ